jgi:hypothetical protein
MFTRNQYGMPAPMSPAPNSTWPPLFPNMTTPQVTPGGGFPNYNQAQAQFAGGGRVSHGHHAKTLRDLADLLEMSGEGRDTILAHINPEEAEELSETHGGDINPYTGLPQFGFWDDIGRGLAQRGLGALDTGIQAGFRRGLPMLGKGAGTLLGGAIAAPTGMTSVPRTLGSLGEGAGRSAGEALSGWYGGTGGLRGLVTPHLDVMAQAGGPNRQTLGTFGQGIKRDVRAGIGGLGQRGLGAADTRIGSLIPRAASSLGSRIGSYFGGRGSEVGRNVGSQLGEYAGKQFGERGGLSSTFGPKIGTHFGLNPMTGSGPGEPILGEEMQQQVPAMARGGRVTHYPFTDASHPFNEEAEMLRRHGQDEDMILAHINPEEAMELDEEYGSDINPETGLPQFGFLKKLEKGLRPLLKMAIPAAVGMGTGMFLPNIFGNVGKQQSRDVAYEDFLKQQQKEKNPEPGFLDKLAQEFGGYGNLGLLGVSGLGALMRRERIPHEPSFAEMVEANKPKWGPEHQYKKAKPFKLTRKELRKGYKAGYEPEEEFFEGFNPEVEYYADGGYLEGGSGGQDDNIDAKLSPGEYVMDATTVSLLGDGNNKAGAKKFDLFRKELRSHKGVNKFLPPKSRPIGSYLKMGGRI